MPTDVNPVFTVGMIMTAISIIPILPIEGTPLCAPVRFKMTRWKISAIAFTVMAICAGSTLQASDDEPSMTRKIISHACATPLQSPGPKQAGYTHSANQHQPIIIPAFPKHETQAIVVTAPPQDEPVEKATQSANTTEVEPDAKVAQNTTPQRFFFTGPFGLELDFNMLAPVTADRLPVPQPHAPETDSVPAEKIPAPQIQARMLPESGPMPGPEATDESPMHYSSTDSPTIETEIFANQSPQDATETDVASDQFTSNGGTVFNFSDDPKTIAVAPSEINSEQAAMQLQMRMQTQAEPLTINFSSPQPAEEMVQPGNHKNQGVIIHAPLVQPYNRNQHTFLVENLSYNAVNDVVIEIAVPEDARIVAALPSNSVFSNNKCAFRFERLAAGEQVQIHVNAVSRGSKPVDFIANVVARSEFAFSTDKPDQSSNMTTVSGEPASVTDLEHETGMVRNPYVTANQQALGTYR